MKPNLNIKRYYPRYVGSILLLFCISICNAQQQFYVSPSGSDSNPGTRAQPFQTISHARNVVKDWNKNNSQNEDITVWLFGGDYDLSQTLVFGINDGARPGQTITYSALPGGKPVITSDVTVTGWKKCTEMPKGLPQVAYNKIWVAPVPESLTSFKVLFNKDGMLPRARTNAMAHLPRKEGERGRVKYHTTIPFHKGGLDSLFYPMHAEIVVIGGAPWTMNILPVKRVDTATGIVYLMYPSTYGLVKVNFGFDAHTIWVENTFAGMRVPGNWVLDKENRLLYLWPEENSAPGNDIVAPRLIELIRVEGEINYDGPKDIPVRGLAFKDITFSHGDRYDSHGQTGRGIQHDWNKFDAATALLRFRGAENCRVENCHFINSGGDAIRFDLYAQHNKVVNNEIADMGGAGVLLVGYGPGTKDVNKNNKISNNYIHNIGTLWWHSMAIWAWQSGHNMISHNTIKHTPYTAIAVTGRILWDTSGRRECSRTVRWPEVGATKGNDSWEEREKFLHGRYNIIKENDISHVMEKMQDGDGIYISGAGRGNIVTGNYIHDIPSDAWGEAIRCDNDQNETIIKNNIIYKFGLIGTAITSKGRNYIFNNIIAWPLYEVRRGMFAMRMKPINCMTVAGSQIFHNIYYTTQSNQPFVYKKFFESCIGCMHLDKNVYFNASNPNAADEYLKWARSHVSEMNSVQADPLFVNIEEGNFQLKQNSPAIKMGFVPITINPGRINNN